MRRILAGLALALGLSSAAWATDCPQFFLGGVEPAVAPAQTAEARELCFHGYALDHSGVWREPIWSAEHLTGAAAKAAHGVSRANPFHPEPSLPSTERAELSDYLGEHLDRGHMTPVGDFPVIDDRNDTFSLANMVPQDSILNERLWAHIEGALRLEAQKDGDLYIVTGPGMGPSPRLLKGRVVVPAYTWKAVYDAKLGGAGAYVAVNDDSQAYVIVPVADIATRFGVDPFPTLDPAMKATVVKLPLPTGAK
jgi:endonuclease G